MEFSFTKDVETKLVASLQRYASENFDTGIGNLQASLFLQFCLKEIGPQIYNRAISDAQKYIQEKALDLENVCYAPESDYWAIQDKQKTPARSRRSAN